MRRGNLLCKMLPNDSTIVDRKAAHVVKMQAKKARTFPPTSLQQMPEGSFAPLNRRTGKPHENKREIARRLGQN